MSLCLMMLFACSNSAQKPVKVSLICPQTVDCQSVENIQIKTNGDLINAFDNALTRLDKCTVAYQVMVDCVNDFNHDNVKQGNKND